MVGSLTGIQREVAMDATPLVVHGVSHHVVVPHTFFMTLMDVLSVGRRWLSSIYKYLSLALRLNLHLNPKYSRAN